MELIGTHIKLTPLTDAHFDALRDIVHAHPEIYQYTTLGTSNADFARWFVLAKQHSAWSVVRLSDDQIIGSTRLYSHNENVGSLNIGYTWYHPESRGTGVNGEAKQLLLNHIFETLNYQRVVFEIHAENSASRRAVEKLGAQLEGVLRQSRRTIVGELGDTAMYAILISDWKKEVIINNK